MVKHTQTVRTNCLSVVGHFVGLALKGLIYRKFVVLILLNNKMNQVALVPLNIYRCHETNLKVSFGNILNDIVRSSHREVIC